MTAATAAALHPDLATAAAAMSRPGRVTAPNPATRAAYDRDYRVFLAMHDQRRALDRIT
jgi:ribulose kinase